VGEGQNAGPQSGQRGDQVNPVSTGNQVYPSAGSGGAVQGGAGGHYSPVPPPAAGGYAPGPYQPANPYPPIGAPYGADAAAPNSGIPAGSYGLDPFADQGGGTPSRIEAAPAPRGSKLLLGLAVGALAGLLVFGATGFFVGRATAPEPPAAAPAPAPEPGLGVFEQQQLVMNTQKFTPELSRLAQGWMPWMGGCLKEGELDGPTLAAGEVAKVSCEVGAMNIYFVQYSSVAERDKAQLQNLKYAVDAPALTPGVQPATKKASPSARSNGNYVEYAYTVGAGEKKRIVGALWWDDANAPVAAYVRAYWVEGMGETWEPLRDLWQRYS